MLNAFYDSYKRYVVVLAEERRKENETIHSQGFVLQIDCPDLAMERTILFQDKSLRELQQIIEMHIAT